MGEANSVLSLKYKISLEDYLNFNFISVEETFKKPRKKALILGSIEIMVGVLLLIAMLFQNSFEGVILVLDIFLIAVGTYSVVFYKLIFPHSLKKSATKQYNAREYLKNEISLDFYPEKLIENSHDGVTEIFWNDIYGFKIAKDIYMIMLSDKRCIIVPKAQIEEKSYELEAFFESVTKEFNKKYIVQK